jgi:hypothetical protein
VDSNCPARPVELALEFRGAVGKSDRALTERLGSEKAKGIMSVVSCGKI